MEVPILKRGGEPDECIVDLNMKRGLQYNSQAPFLFLTS